MAAKIQRGSRSSPSRKSASPKAGPDASRRRAPARKSATSRQSPRAPKKWSAAVMQKSDAMDLEPGVFKQRSPAAVARSLKHSVEASHRRKSPPFRSAMSMLNFEINRGGKNLSAEQKRVLNKAKQELRKLFGRAPA